LEQKNIPTVEDVLVKKGEGRPVTPEEFMILIQFIERVERRTVEQLKATALAEEERLFAARSDIPNIAFETSIDALGLPDKIHNILSEAEKRTVGELMLTMKLNPDDILGLAGIGPKSLEAIKTALANITFPEPEPIPEPLAEAPAELTAEVPAEIPAEAAAAPGLVEIEPAAIPVEGAPVVASLPEGELAEKPLEEIFSLRPDMLAPVPATAEEEEDESDKKKGKKKKKKVVEIVYDEDLEKAIAMKKHKRGDEGWDED